MQGFENIIIVVMITILRLPNISGTAGIAGNPPRLLRVGSHSLILPANPLDSAVQVKSYILNLQEKKGKHGSNPEREK